KSLDGVHQELWAAAKRVVQEYQTAGMPTMVMDLAWRMGADLSVPGMFEMYEAALRQGGRPIQIWQLAYNEKNLAGWASSEESIFKADGKSLAATFGAYDESLFDY